MKMKLLAAVIWSPFLCRPWWAMEEIEIARMSGKFNSPFSFHVFQKGILG